MATRTSGYNLELANDLKAQAIGIRCLDQSFDTNSSEGRFMFGILALVAEFERDLIIERTNDGLARARAQGKVIGSPPALNAAQIAQVPLLRAQGYKVNQICQMMNASPATIYRVLERSR
jgi:DNA invertase Pin-like site-specific DNA recombinase